MARTAREKTDAREETPGAEDATGAGHICNVAFCPIGLALTAAGTLQPDAVSHLLAAGKEFFLAAKAVVDARAEDLDGEGGRAPTRLERIDIG